MRRIPAGFDPAAKDMPLRRVVLLTYENMNLLDLAGPLQALATVNRRSTARAPTYETIVASAAGGLVRTGSGLAVETVALATLDGTSVDTLIVTGGCKGDRYDAPAPLVEWIISRAPHLRRLCSVCTGAFMLAAAGQLSGRKVATHWEWAARLQAEYPDIRVDPDRIFIRDGSVWTSAGVSAGIDLALALIEEDCGHRVAIDVARQLVVFIRRSGGQSQFGVGFRAQSQASGAFSDLHAWMAANLDGDLRVERLASQAGMSPRTFARLYLQRIGRTPARTVEAMRLEAARRALEETELPLKVIAAEVGLGPEQNLRRAFDRIMKTNPAEYRQRFGRHAVERTSTRSSITEQ